MNKIGHIQTLALEFITEALVVQGQWHTSNIVKYYNIMYMAAFKEFTEDNDPTLKSFLLEQFVEALGIDKEYAIKLLKDD